jgi:hypothetical protein
VEAAGKLFGFPENSFSTFPLKVRSPKIALDFMGTKFKLVEDQT